MSLMCERECEEISRNVWRRNVRKNSRNLGRRVEYVFRGVSRVHLHCEKLRIKSRFLKYFLKFSPIWSKSPVTSGRLVENEERGGSMDNPFNAGQSSAVLSVLNDVAVERMEQHKKWGEQSHPDGTGPNEGLAVVNVIGDFSAENKFSILAKDFTDSTDYLFARKAGTWADILLEEVFEALAESDAEKLREELIQNAAVLVAWVENIDRRNS